ELRNRLKRATGMSLPTTLIFDHPSCSAVAKFILTLVQGEQSDAGSVGRRDLVTRRAGIDEPVVIVGMSCRYPGSSTAQELWELVVEGRDAISGLPVDRGWDLDGIYDPDPDHVGTSYTRRGSFVEGVGAFDADFFGISPREALGMDPQQRM